jgi:hypothetical protein
MLGRVAAILLIAFMCSPGAYAESLRMYVGGGLPGSEAFDVSLHAGRLIVTRSSLPITRRGLTTSSVTGHLSASAEHDLVVVAQNAATDFAQGCGAVADGTVASLSVGGHELAQCQGAPQWPTGPRTRLLLRAINANLPTSIQVQ